MKRRRNWLCLMIAFSMFFTGCQSKNPETYSPLSAEEMKVILQESGIHYEIEQHQLIDGRQLLVIKDSSGNFISFESIGQGGEKEVKMSLFPRGEFTTPTSPVPEEDLNLYMGIADHMYGLKHAAPIHGSLIEELSGNENKREAAVKRDGNNHFQLSASLDSADTKVKTYS